jgi:hypothetical protein
MPKFSRGSPVLDRTEEAIRAKTGTHFFASRSMLLADTTGEAR